MNKEYSNFEELRIKSFILKIKLYIYKFTNNLGIANNLDNKGKLATLNYLIHF